MTTPSADSEGIDLDGIIQRLLTLRSARPGTLVDLEEHEIVSLVNGAREQFLNEPMLLRPQAPIKINGDLHGQFYDLVRIIDHCGQPPNTNYLFLGDYCDRGKQSIEVLCLLFAFKLKHPTKMHLLRGNHETQRVSRMYGFYDECKRRYSVKLWKIFCEAFDCMPCAAVVSDKILCVHGGISPELTSLEQIDAIERPVDVPDEGLLTDLVWADPEPGIDGWEVNDRGVSFIFGEDVLKEFLKDNDLDLLVRAHQVVEDGYEFFGEKKCVTIFSAPNYCGEFGNAGATMIVDADLQCRFQLLKPSTKSIGLASRKIKVPGKKLTPLEMLKENARKVKNAMKAVNAFGESSAENYLAGLEAKKECKDADVDYRSYHRSKRTSIVASDGNGSTTVTSVVEEIHSSEVRFSGNALILQTEDLTKRNTTWGDVWEDLFYDADELAEFRHEAFVAECEEEEEMGL